MRLRHFLFGLFCLTAAGILSSRQSVDSYRAGYRVERLRRQQMKLEEARARLEAAIALEQRPDHLMGQAAELSLTISEPDLDDTPELPAAAGEPGPEERP